ncbi:hypothetical protein PHPALM_30488 [Phytophthora palmivora]|uniref:Uncharacterized protein n=1 Tax=Phytophthora palmivora TaxID=4796 RepID=A0A2P4X531_9STRA|nr:hypothetical protein PHPALM_30488 [Phytophthora palmivora]
MVTVVNTDHVSANALDWKFGDSNNTYSNKSGKIFMSTLNDLGLPDKLNPLQRFSRDSNARFSTLHPSMATFLTTINQISAEYGLHLADIPRGSARRIRREVIELSTPMGLLKKLENTVEV